MPKSVGHMNVQQAVYDGVIFSLLMGLVIYELQRRDPRLYKPIFTPDRPIGSLKAGKINCRAALPYGILALAYLIISPMIAYTNQYTYWVLALHILIMLMVLAVLDFILLGGFFLSIVTDRLLMILGIHGVPALKGLSYRLRGFALVIFLSLPIAAALGGLAWVMMRLFMLG